MINRKTTFCEINVWQDSIERSVVGVKRQHRVTLKEIKRKTRFKNIVEVYKTLKWKWTGHLIREKMDKTYDRLVLKRWKRSKNKWKRRKRNRNS